MIVETDARQKELKAFKKLPEEYRNHVMELKTEDVYKEISRKAVNTVQLSIAKEMDQDLKRLQEELSTARAVYTDGVKENTLSIRFAVDVLRSRGVTDLPSPEDFIRKAANGEIND
jgi:hypothetical protein